MNRTTRTRRWLMAATLGLLLCAGLAVAADESARGTWSGAIELPGMKLDYTLKVSASDSDLTGSVDIPAQGAFGIATVDLRATDDSLVFGLKDVPGSPTFFGRFSPDRDTVAGDFTQAGSKFPFAMTRVTAEESQQQADSLKAALDEIRRIVDSARSVLKVPGVAVAIVKGGEVIMTEGFGWRDVADSLPVTSSTLFAIGSSSKAFTTMALGMLVDDGKVEWDKPVRTYLPWFALEDEFASDRVTVRDLVTHRTGLPRHDLAWYGTDIPRDTLIYRARYLKANEGFRTTFQYQNLMFLTAGQLAAHMNGTTWEELIKTRILDPLGMMHTNFSVTDLTAAPERAIGYGESHDTLTVLPYRNIDDMAPAGAINADIGDMAKWVKLFLDEGKVADNRLIGEGQLAEMYTCQIPIGHPGTQTERLLTGYGLGWFIEAYRGHYRVQHGGNIDGFSALVSFLPYDNIGIVVLTNKNATGLPSVVSLSATDRLLGLEPIGWLAQAGASSETADSLIKASQENAAAGRVGGTRPSHKLEEYAGVFENPGYGALTIAYQDKKLRCVFNAFDWPMEHWHYDIFQASDKDLGQDLLLDFQTNTKGDIDRVSVPLEAAVDPIVFTRRASDELSDPTYLRKFLGKYTLAGTDITVAMTADRLQVTVPGQPSYALEPYKLNEFNLKGLPGYSVVFKLDKSGIPTAAEFHQPNGIFSAERVKE